MVRGSMIWFLRFFNNMNILLQRDQRLDTGYWIQYCNLQFAAKFQTQAAVTKFLLLSSFNKPGVMLENLGEESRC